MRARARVYVCAYARTRMRARARVYVRAHARTRMRLARAIAHARRVRVRACVRTRKRVKITEDLFLNAIYLKTFDIFVILWRIVCAYTRVRASAFTLLNILNH